MNAREKLNAWHFAAAVMVGLIVANTAGTVVVFLIVAAAWLMWATNNRHIR